MMIDFENIHNEIILAKQEKSVALTDEKNEIILDFDLDYFLSTCEKYQVFSKDTASECLFLSLQARQILQVLDKQRKEILSPHQDFIKTTNKKFKFISEKLEEIEKVLSDRILFWLENPEEAETLKINSENGTLTKRISLEFKIKDLSLVPTEYLKIDEKKIELAIKNGVHDIPGIEFLEVKKADLRLKNT